MDPILHNLGFLLSRASGLVARNTNEALAPEGLRVRQYSVLSLAAEATDGISQRELADALGLSPSQVVLLIDELTAVGLAERRPSPTDRRTRLIAATPAGHAALERSEERVQQGLQNHLRGLDPSEQTALRQLLGRIIEAP